MEQTTFKKPSVILSELLAENPDIELAEGSYYDGHGCFCALGHIAHARGYSGEDCLNKPMKDVLSEFYWRNVKSNWYPNLDHAEVTAINDRRERAMIDVSDHDRLKLIIKLLQDKGL